MRTPVSTGSWRAQISQLQEGAGSVAPSALPTKTPREHQSLNARNPELQASPFWGLSVHRSRGPRPPRPVVSLRAGPANQGAPGPRASSPWLWWSRPAAACRQMAPAPPRLRRLPATDGRSRAKSRRSSRDSAGRDSPSQQPRRVPSNAHWAEPGVAESGRFFRQPRINHALHLPEIPKRISLRDFACVRD